MGGFLNSTDPSQQSDPDSESFYLAHKGNVKPESET